MTVRVRVPCSAPLTKDDYMSTIIHIDMDAFYASVEQKDKKDLRGRPIAIGGRSDRGVVSTASYEARKYGVRSAMSIQKAKTLCPNLIVIPGNMEKYKRVSREIFNILRSYSDIVERLSIDEAFLDITGTDYIGVCKNIKKDINERLGLTCSIGVSYNKFLAKLASDMEKPNGLTFIGEKEAVEVLKPLPINKILGVGPMMERELNRLGIYYIEDLQNYNPKILVSKFGKKGKDLYKYSLGIDSRSVERNEDAQSIGEEETFHRDISDREELLLKLRDQSKDLKLRLDAGSLMFRTITIKVKYSDFQVETRGVTMSIPANSLETIEKMSENILLTRFRLNKSVRLIGITLSNFIYPDDPKQLTLIN